MSDDEKSASQEIRERLLEARSEDELDRIRKDLADQGFNEGTVRSVVSELRRKKLLPEGRMPAPTRPLPMEGIIQDLKLPSEVSNGAQRIFDAGVAYGIKTVLVGIRAAQELSALGVQQAQPLIKMAQEMRMAEGQSAEKAVSEMAGRAMSYMDQKFAELPAPAGPNPFAEMMARVMEGPLKNLMGGFGGQPGQGQQVREIPGFTTRTVKREEIEDA